MDLVKYGHACVAVESAGRRLVIDPGAFTPEDVLPGTEAVLVTHDHHDHVDVARLRAALEQDPALQVWTTTPVAVALCDARASHDGDASGLASTVASRVHEVAAGETFGVAGFEVAVFGEQHAEIHRDLPRTANVGFLLDDVLFHPGDALTVPEADVEVLLVPVHAPWSKTGEVLDWIRAVAPQRTVAIHDALLSELGLGLVARLLGADGPAGVPYERLEPGERITVA